MSEKFNLEQQPQQETGQETGKESRRGFLKKIGLFTAGLLAGRLLQAETLEWNPEFIMKNFLGGIETVKSEFRGLDEQYKELVGNGIIRSPSFYSEFYNELKSNKEIQNLKNSEEVKKLATSLYQKYLDKAKEEILLNRTDLTGNKEERIKQLELKAKEQEELESIEKEITNLTQQMRESSRKELTDPEFFIFVKSILTDEEVGKVTESPNLFPTYIHKYANRLWSYPEANRLKEEMQKLVKIDENIFNLLPENTDEEDLRFNTENDKLNKSLSKLQEDSKKSPARSDVNVSSSSSGGHSNLYKMVCGTKYKSKKGLWQKAFDSRFISQ